MLLGIDFSNLIIRHAMNPYAQATDQAGRPVSGVVGGVSQVLRLIGDLQPEGLLIARDGPRSQSLRREIDPSYKAHRPDSDEEIKHQFVLAYELLEEMNWPVVAETGHEADDILASAARSWPGKVKIVSGDKDLLALCSERVQVMLLRPGGFLDCGPDQCHDLVGVWPAQVNDYKALVGDPSDGISGISGIGKKTALKLLADGASLDQVYERLEAGEITEVAERFLAKLRAGREDAYRSRELARLIDDIELDLDSFSCPAIPHDSEFGERLAEMGLSDLRKALPGGSPAPKKGPLDLEGAFNRATGG